LAESPTGNTDRGIGSGNWQFFIPMWLQKSFGPWLMYGGSGYWFTSGVSKNNWWLFGYTLQRQITDFWSVGIELYHTMAKNQFNDEETYVNIGTVYDFSKLHHILFSMGRGIQ